ncbi:MAG: ankyrin repeat domain-containing protein [Candidatus Tisiphia sp.]
MLNKRQHLCLASMKGHIDIVKWLIDKGSDVNIPNNYMYPLHLAVNVN